MSLDGLAELEAGRWIKKQVEAETNLKAYLDVLPEGTDFPAIRYEVYVPGDDVRVIDQHIVMTKVMFRVYVTIQGERITQSFIEAVADIHAALHRKRGETSNARIIACTRNSTYTRTENAGAEVFRHAGGLYELLVQDLSA
jgi:hypothetical protein